MTIAKPKLIVILGPTAVGKTALSVELASRLQAERISGDSMQVYRHMDIGTAKIKENEKTAKDGSYIKHHLIDIIEPDQPYSVLDFQKAAGCLVAEINKQGRLPIIAGGTGLYISALIDGYTFTNDDGEDQEFRLRKMAEFDQKGGLYLWQELFKIDPEAAKKINENDAKRLIRALEVHQSTGQKISEAKKNPPDWDVRLIGLTRPRPELYQRINERVLQMIDDGLVEEVKKLLAAGFSQDLKPMQALGYKQICSYLDGEYDLSTAVAEIQKATRHFAKRQLTWWRRDLRVNWFDLSLYADEEELISRMVKICQ